MEIQKYYKPTDRLTWVGARDACTSKNICLSCQEWYPLKKVYYFRQCPDQQPPLTPQFGQLGPFVPDVKTLFIAYDRKSTNDDYDDCNDTYDTGVLLRIWLKQGKEKRLLARI